MNKRGLNSLSGLSAWNSSISVSPQLHERRKMLYASVEYYAPDTSSIDGPKFGKRRSSAEEFGW